MARQKALVPVVEIPAGSNRLAKVAGKKFRKIREGFGLSIIECAKQTAVPESVLYFFEHGQLTPNQALAERLRDWAIGRIDFTGQPPPRSKAAELEAASDFSVVKTKIDAPLAKKLRIQAKRLGYSQSALVHLAIERFLLDQPALNTLERAKKAIDTTRIQMALQEAPALRDILDCEVDLIVKSGQGILREPPKQLAIEELADHVEENKRRFGPFNEWQEI